MPEAEQSDCRQPDPDLVRSTDVSGARPNNKDQFKEQIYLINQLIYSALQIISLNLKATIRRLWTYIC